MRRRRSSSTTGLGVSSTSFWWRRCTEQSRSPSQIAVPCASARIWISTWRGSGQVALEVDGAVGEEALALAPGALEGVLERLGRRGDAEALAAPAGRRLDRDRVADGLGDRDGRGEVGDRVGDPGHDRHAGLVHQRPRARLRAHRLDGVRRRADPGDAGLAEGAREAGVLGQEAVARVHGLGARLADHLQQPRDVQVALGRRPRAEQVRLVGVLHEQRVAVHLAVDGHRGDAHLAQGAEDADGDLAPVGDQHLGEHQRRLHGGDGAARSRRGASASGRPAGRGRARAPGTPRAPRRRRRRWRRAAPRSASLLEAP